MIQRSLILDDDNDDDGYGGGGGGGSGGSGSGGDGGGGNEFKGGNHDGLVTYVQSERIGFVSIASGNNNNHNNHNHNSHNRTSFSTSSPSTVVSNGGTIQSPLPPPSSSPVTRPIAKKYYHG